MANILFINHDPKTIEQMQDYLTTNGHSVLVAHRADQGIHCAVESKPDVIFVDPILPGVTGPQIIYKLRQHAAMKLTPIILLDWPIKHPEKIQFALAMGATEVVQKSLQVIEVGDMVGRYVEMKTGQNDFIQAILYINRANSDSDAAA